MQWAYQDRNRGSWWGIAAFLLIPFVVIILHGQAEDPAPPLADAAQRDSLLAALFMAILEQPDPANTRGESALAGADHSLPDDSTARPVTRLSASPLRGIEPMKVNFSCEINDDVYAYWWYFGDGTSSNRINPEHRYTAPGTYYVTLTTTRADGLQTDTLRDSIIVHPAVETVMFTPQSR